MSNGERVSGLFVSTVVTAIHVSDAVLLELHIVCVYFITAIPNMHMQDLFRVS